MVYIYIFINLYAISIYYIKETIPHISLINTENKLCVSTPHRVQAN